MADLDSTLQEDPRLQADPVLILCEGRATFGRKLFTSVVATGVIVGTLYGLFHQRGETSRSMTAFAVPVLVLPVQ